MSIESKHAYRFGYLKSEQWSNVRLDALAREKGKCQICFEESISNDAHHVWYPENIYDTTERHLVILCRPCHEFCHSMLPACKTKDEEDGLAQWRLFRNAIIAWRTEHMKLFSTLDGLKITAPELRQELTRVKGILANTATGSTNPNLGEIFDQIKRLAKMGHDKIQCLTVDNHDYSI